MSPATMKTIALMVWTALAFWAGSAFTHRGAALESSRADGARAVAAVEQINEARATEHQQAESMATIGAKHEEDRTAAEAVPAAVVADLRAGNLRLRDDLATCHTERLSEAAAAAGERDARAELRPEVAGAALRIVTDAEHHVLACQAVIRRVIAVNIASPADVSRRGVPRGAINERESE